MKIKSLFVAILLMAGVLFTPQAAANEKPAVESFSVSPTEIEITSAKPEVKVELVASHPFGIAETIVFASISNGANVSYRFPLTRIDSPINADLTKVTFRGSYILPSDLDSGIYSVSVDVVRNNWRAGYQYESIGTTLISNSNVLGAENSLVIRKQGAINLAYDTFVGPTHDLTKNFTYLNTKKYFFGLAPIWRVGESYDPNDFFEIRVKNLPLEILSSTPTICPLVGETLKFVREGVCKFTVQTSKDLNYVEKKIEISVNILSPRIQSTLSIPKISNQTVDNLPKIVSLPLISSPAIGWVLPNSLTPTICSTSGFTVKIISGGTCNLSYQTAGNDDFLASPTYIQPIEIIKNPQTISFTLAPSVELAKQSVVLTSTTSSGGAVIFTSVPAEVCSVSGTTLKLLKPGPCEVTATQPGTGTIAAVSVSASVLITGSTPVVKKTITCVKGTKTIKKTAVSPKCPKEYKLKK
jgi:hypothetical protein